MSVVARPMRVRQEPAGVARGFEAVRRVFQHGAADLGAGGAAFCAYVDGAKVVDLWAGETRPGVPWERDTTAVVMSTTKGLAALCAQILYDRGELDVDAPVATYWPEFAAAGKRDVLVRHVLNHTSGVLCFADPGSLLDWEGNGWDDYDEIARRLAASAPSWKPGSRIAYHAVSSGWMTGELVRRISGTTIGTFLREHVAEPLGADAWIGTPHDAQARIADVVHPCDLGVADEVRALLQRPETIFGQAAICMHGSNVIEQLPQFMNRPRVRGLEIASGNGSATARGLARIHAMLAMGGTLDGVRIVSPASVAAFGAETANGPHADWPEVRLPSGEIAPASQMRYALGYAGNVTAPGQPPAFGPVDSAFGHTGAGGQVAFCDPVNRIAVGFVRNQLAPDAQFCGALVDAVYACAGVHDQRYSI